MGNRIEIALSTNPTHRSFSDAFTVPAFTHQILFESLLEGTNYSEFHQHRSGKELHIPHAIVMIQKMTLLLLLNQMIKEMRMMTDPQTLARMPET